MAKQLAKTEGTAYQQWLRERVSESVRNLSAGQQLRHFKLVYDDSAQATVIARTKQEAIDLATKYANKLYTSGQSFMAPSWIPLATVKELPIQSGVSSWAEVGIISMQKPDGV